MSMLASKFKDERVQKIVMAVMGAIFAGGVFLYWAESGRSHPDFDGVNRELAQIEQEIDLLEGTPPLPSVYAQWQVARLIALAYDVEFVPVEDGNPLLLSADMVDSGLLWQGVLQGAAAEVLMAAIEIQKTLPSLMGAYQVRNNEGVMVMGLIGSSPKKMNTN